MPAGLQVINDSGTIQIDSEWQNYALFSVNTIFSDNNQWGETAYAGVVHTSSIGEDLVFASCGSAFFPVCIVQVNGVRQYKVGTGSAVGIPVTFFTFRRQPPRSSTYGLQVFDGNGQLAFDALDKRCRIAGTIPSNQLASIGTYAFRANRQYAVLAPSFTGQLIEQDSAPDMGGMGWKFLGTNCARLRLFSSGVNVEGYAFASEKQIPIFNPRPGVNITNVLGDNYIVADVTGY